MVSLLVFNAGDGVRKAAPLSLVARLEEMATGDIEIVTDTEEFTSVCPFSGLPDFASVTIIYTPDRNCIELRSLKYYLMSYRDVGIWYEHLVNRMLQDLVRIAKPKHMHIEVACNARGGLVSTVHAEYIQEIHGEQE